MAEQITLPCPLCGGAIADEGGHTRCTRCRQVLDGCCEGGACRPSVEAA